MPEVPTDAELRSCAQQSIGLSREASAHVCRFWHDGAGFPEDGTYTVWYIPDGSLSLWGCEALPLSAAIVPCARHLAAEAAASGSYDGDDIVPESADHTHQESAID